MNRNFTITTIGNQGSDEKPNATTEDNFSFETLFANIAGDDYCFGVG